MPGMQSAFPMVVPHRLQAAWSARPAPTDLRRRTTAQIGPGPFRREPAWTGGLVIGVQTPRREQERTPE